TFRIGRQLLDGGDVRVLRAGPQVGGAVVVREGVPEVVAVLIPVGREGGVLPGRGGESDIGFGQRGVGGGGVRELLELDRVAELFELILQQEGHHGGIGPRGHVPDGDRVAVALFGAGCTGAGGQAQSEQARAAGERGAAAQGRRGQRLGAR